MVNPQQGPGKSGQQNIIQFIKEHKWESFSYFLLFFGLVLSVFDKTIGGLIVGLIIGIYFSEFFKEKAQDFKKFIHDEGVFRGFIIIASMLALIIIAFGLCVGTFIGTVIKPYLPET